MTAWPLCQKTEINCVSDLVWVQAWLIASTGPPLFGTTLDPSNLTRSGPSNAISYCLLWGSRKNSNSDKGTAAYFFLDFAFCKRNHCFLNQWLLMGENIGLFHSWQEIPCLEPFFRDFCLPHGRPRNGMNGGRDFCWNFQPLVTFIIYSLFKMFHKIRILVFFDFFCIFWKIQKI